MNTRPQVIEKRKEERYPCVGIGRIYSAQLGKNISGFGRMLHHAAVQDLSLAGLSFDVALPVEIGQKLVLQIEQPAGDTYERLISVVCRCVKTHEWVYRVGVRIDASELVLDSSRVLESVGIGPSMPVGVELLCPACGRHASFRFAGYQKVDEDRMPLYDCDTCGTTRTFTGVLAQNSAQLAAATIQCAKSHTDK
jgi:hypothetical protein